MPLSHSTRDKLKTVSTATLCSALFKRGLRNQFIQNVLPLNSSLPNMVGEAFTLRYIPALNDDAAHVQALTALYRRHAQGWE